MAQRVTLAIPDSANPGQDMNLGTSANPIYTQTGTPSATSSVKREDSPSADLDYGSASLWVRRDTNTSRVSADGDYINPAVDQFGNVKTVVAQSTGTDRSLTATTTSAQLMAANTSRIKFFIKNDSLIVVWINMGATAVAAAGSGNIAIAASGGYFEFTGYSGAVSIIAASTTAAITAREF